MMKQTVEYEIVDIDWFENDAVLVVGDNRYYFQWDAKAEPTIIDALEFFKKDSIYYRK
jgi:hypothetical protein